VAEGIAVKMPGVLTRQLISALVDEIISVDEAGLEAPVHMLLIYQPKAPASL
jgi:threonine dehydratase